MLGPLHFFMCNSGGNEPDGNGSTSLQAHWLSNQLARSKSPWKIIVLHHPPYSSSGFSQELRWPFEQWGAHAVLAGHVHSYERLDVPGFPYIVNGAGGAALEGDVTPIAASRAQYNADHGAMLGRATAASLELSFVSVAEGGTVIDTLTITNQASPRLRVTRLGGGTNEISWSTNFVGYALESATSLKSASSWAQVSQSPSVRGASYSVRIGATGNAAYYRLRAAAAT